MQATSTGTSISKHVVAINGSPREGATNKLLEDIAEARPTGGIQ